MKIISKLLSQHRIILFTFILFVLVSIYIFLILFNLSTDLPQIPTLIGRTNYNTKSTKIFSSDGSLIFTLGGHQTVELENVSQDFIHAIVATEDHRFWSHSGINKLRILKAIFVTLLIPNKVQGASTITQQLAKNLFFSFEKTYSRKLREFLVALQIEAQFHKNDILEAYINQIPFGSGAYGIEQAARFFFGKSSSSLTLAEASLLAGVPKSPTRYNPYRYPDRAKKRQLIVLKRMLQVGLINKKQLIAAYKTPLSYHSCKKTNQPNSYFIDAIIKYLEKNYGTEIIYHGGLKVYTTMNLEVQRFAELSLQNGLNRLDNQIIPTNVKNNLVDSNIKLQGAIVSIDVNTGAVVAMVGGRNFYDTPFNRAVKNNRQPGSGFKPFLYYAAFEDGGMSPNDVIIDKKISISIPGSGLWEPRNFGRHYKGPVVIKKAFVDSINTVAVQLVDKLGPKAVINIAHKCGIKSHLDPVYSVALGTSGVSPFEMASSFSTFASGGIYKEPHMILRIEDINGSVLEEHVRTSKQVLNPAICYQVVDMMCDVVNVGPGKIVRYMGLNMDVAGKTGTTNGYNDAWFTGFTTSLSSSVWVGFDKNYGMKYKCGMGVTGGTGAAPIWSDFMLKIRDIYPSDQSFYVPDNISFHIIDSSSGKKAKLWTKNSIKIALRNKKYIKKVPKLTNEDR